MEDHILEVHVEPINDLYHCDECMYCSKDKSKFSRHYKSKHGSNSQSTASKITSRLLAVENELRKNTQKLNNITKEYNTSQHNLKIMKLVCNLLFLIGSNLGSSNPCFQNTNPAIYPPYNNFPRKSFDSTETSR